MYGKLNCVKKRDGNIVDFDISRLQKSIIDIIVEVKEYDESNALIHNVARRLSFLVSNDLVNCIDECGIVDINVIYDKVTDKLFDSGYIKTGRRYIEKRYTNVVNELTKELEVAKRSNRMLEERYDYKGN